MPAKALYSISSDRESGWVFSPGNNPLKIKIINRYIIIYYYCNAYYFLCFLIDEPSLVVLPDIKLM
jgi:hypothetical protein